ncbi:RNA-directed DNA polymerase [Paenibacillus sp. Lou8.1]|uniref:RNA-directed DNA polymerase n=1 Tax=Paenibacillus sp. Lou8.1 TaxID=2962041 RepID=UPI0020B76026|nr:RNA-directed DNA polymerase [Paenibacillus sp. Lou8.1]MCP3807736.1 RNA-directed DNA polymerase [Paenibacillus sp. Lou8.1]
MTTKFDLIQRGFFPQELPPPFTTITLANNLNSISMENTATSKCITYDIPRVKLQRRHLAIPNPLHQIKLSQAIETNWSNLQAHFDKSKLSISRPISSEKRAVETSRTFGDLVSERILRSPDKRIVLKTDISRYYPTIYTHSLPWALHTKALAKVNRQDNYYGNLLDRHMRNCQDGQTIGIPIGPDTSLIISEIIGSEIDSLLQTSIPNIQGVRYIDDYFLYFDTIAEAEKAHSVFHQILREFELDHNSEKTSINPLPENLLKEWVFDLQSSKVRFKSIAQKNDIISYFSKAFDYIYKYPEDFVLKYALERSKTFSVTHDNWSLYESLILKSMIVEPNTLQVSLEILLSYQSYGYILDREKIAQTLKKIILHHSSFSHCYEVSWALWICQSLKIDLKSEVSHAISQMTNSIVILLALDLQSKGYISGINIDELDYYLKQNSIFEDQWLLTYESQIKGWLSGEGFDRSEFFISLQDHNVTFYDDKRQVETFIPKEIESVLEQIDQHEIMNNVTSLSLY